MAGRSNLRSAPGSKVNQRFPRAYSLKRRHFLRSLFQAGRSDVVSSAAGSVRVLARAVPLAQLPSGVRVQTGFAARRGSSGVQRTQTRRMLREAFRTRVLPDLLLQIGDVIPETSGLTVMILDRRRADSKLDSLDSLARSIQKALHRATESLGSLPAHASPETAPAPPSPEQAPVSSARDDSGLL